MGVVGVSSIIYFPCCKHGGIGISQIRASYATKGFWRNISVLFLGTGLKAFFKRVLKKMLGYLRRPFQTISKYLEKRLVLLRVLPPSLLASF